MNQIDSFHYILEAMGLHVYIFKIQIHSGTVFTDETDFVIYEMSFRILKSIVTIPRIFLV